MDRMVLSAEAELAVYSEDINPSQTSNFLPTVCIR
jgi:hypothetical protein